VQFTGFSPREGGTRNDLGNLRSSRLDEQIGFVRAQAGERMASIELSALVQRMVVTNDATNTVAELATQFGVSVGDIVDCPYIFVGSTSGIAELLRERSERFGITSWVVLSLRPGVDGPPSTLAPVLSALA
jgi:hypothetical protein